MNSIVTQAQIKEAIELLKVCLSDGTIRDLNQYTSTGTRKIEQTPIRSILSYGLDSGQTHEEDPSYYYVKLEFCYHVPADAIQKFINERNSDDAVKNLLKDI